MIFWGARLKLFFIIQSPFLILSLQQCSTREEHSLVLLDSSWELKYHLTSAYLHHSSITGRHITQWFYTSFELTEITTDTFRLVLSHAINYLLFIFFFLVHFWINLSRWSKHCVNHLLWQESGELHAITDHEIPVVPDLLPSLTFYNTML